MKAARAMDVLKEPVHYSYSAVYTSTIAKIASLALPSYVCHGIDSSGGLLPSTASVPNIESDDKSKPSNADGKAEEETILQTSEIAVSRELDQQIRKQILTEASLPGEIRVRIDDSESSNQIQVVEVPFESVPTSNADCGDNTLCREECVSYVSEGLQPASPHKAVRSLVTVESIVDGELPTPDLPVKDTDFSQKQLCREVLSCSDEVPSNSEKQSDSGSGVSTDHWRPRGRYDPDPNFVGSGSEGRHVKREDGIWKFHREHIRTNLDGDFTRYPVGSFLEDFLPIPGDIMITKTPRRPFMESYLGSNPGGHVTIFVDRNYFERDQAAREDIQNQMARFFEPNDMIIRYGKFYPGWIWHPHAHIEFFQYRPRLGPNATSQPRWYVYGRLPNNIALGPSDPFNAPAMVLDRVQPQYSLPGAFVPRTADIVIRSPTNELFFIDDENPVFEEDADFLNGDLIFRFSIEKYPSNTTYLRFTVDLLMNEQFGPRGTRHAYSWWRWRFRGRDRQLFGPPNLDHLGREQTLDLNGIEPFIRRPIPHWGLARAVFGIEAPPGLPP